ncbi:serine/threonine-protein phosphatase 6 regulatory ankyrin repeat subunit B-like isoform X2 [Actinia tenebrosa]|uniref:Serine/threonine-protein phosphatase 6 regulatory ankyrin repeat subunit B-like isoform X2 n=1 Tax=Actinia tenebrosa TaxID=6105 RepID=A0A6P8HAB9_ACTTE|nr:serine/threonine-protein phosphatase 6 regulatory ankyrin repeat subunit B-like isoform X2 [Actinia tenebrosa]
MKNEAFIASNNSLNEGIDLAGAGQEKKKKKSKTWSVVVKKAASLEMNELTSHYRTAISDVHEAVREGTLDVVDQVIARAKKAKNLNDLDDTGLSGLHHAVRYNRCEAVAKLLDHGAQVNIRSRDESNTPLHISSRFGWRETTKLLLDHGANPNAKNNNGCTPLHFACRRGNKELVLLLLDNHSIQINAVDKSLLTPLHVAGIHGDAELCKMLLDRGADYMAQAVDKTTPLHVAVANGNHKASKVILDQAIAMSANMADIVNARDIDSNTILHLAALTNNKEIAEEILKYQPSVNLTKTDFATPLHLACTKGHLEMVKLFILKGADIQYSRTFDGRTALHKAASFGHLDIINFLLDEGAKVDARDYTNRTPFLEAVANGQSGSAVLLLSRGAEITAYDNQVKNCLHLAIENENQDTLMVLLDTDGCLENLYSPDIRERVPLHYAAVCSNIKVLQVLLKKQTRFIFQDENQQTPMYLAAEAGRADHVEALGRAGSSINDRDDEGRSALHVAAAKGHRKVCEKLIKRGADVNCRDNLRSTPLMAAARNGGIKTCETLLENEAEIDNVNTSEDTALLEAVRYNHVAVVELLLDCGASVTVRNNTNLGLIDTAVKYGSSDVVMAICRHQRWKEILNIKAGVNGQPPMKLLIAHFPDAAKLIMDKCVQPAENMSPSHFDYTITYDFQLLDPGPDDPAFIRGKRYFGPEIMVQNNQENLLLHPLTQKLLEKKWSALGKTVYFLSFYTFLAFTILYTVFLVEERRYASFRPLAATNTSQASSIFRKSSLGGSVPFVILVFAVAQMAKEFLQIFLQRKMYFTQATNALEWALYGSTVVFMIPYVASDSWVDINYGRFKDPYIMWIIAVVSIFLCYVNFVLFLRRFATLGLYISMHMEVIWTVTKVMVVFIVFVFAFSVVFYILFKE